MDILRSPLIGSPIRPVSRIINSWSSKRDISFGLIKRLSLARDNFLSRIAVRTIFSISNPVKTTRRPVSAAASKTCWIRERLLATAATMIRPSQSAMVWVISSPTSLSLATWILLSALAESLRSAKTPSRPISAKRAKSVA